MGWRVLQNFLRALIVIVALSSQALAQGIQPVNPLSPGGSRLFPNPFASADNIAAQTATFMHGGMMAWDSGGGNWDRLLLTSGALHVNVQNASLAVTGTFWQATQPVSGTVTVIQGTGTNLHMVCDSGCTPGGSTADNSAFTFGTTTLNPAGYVFDDTTPNAVTENNVATPRMSANRVPYATLRDAAGNERGANVNASNELLVALSSVPTHTVNVGTFPDNEPINVAQMNGVAVSMGNGVSGTGVQRVTIASDSTGLVNALGTLADDGVAAGTNRVGTLPAIAQSGYNSSTNGRNTALNTGAGDGLLQAAVLPSTAIPSYSASAVVASAASATDIAILPGNATNTVLVTEVRVSCTQTTAGTIQLHVIKRSTANSGGTSAGMTEVPDDSSYAAASSAALTYTANPTPGTAVGDVDIAKLGCMATGTAAPNDVYIANFRQKPIVLRGTAQGLAVNLNGATVSGGSFTVTYKFMEVTGL